MPLFGGSPTVVYGNNYVLNADGQSEIAGIVVVSPSNGPVCHYPCRLALQLT